MITGALVGAAIFGALGVYATHDSKDVTNGIFRNIAALIFLASSGALIGSFF